MLIQGRFAGCARQIIIVATKGIKEKSEVRNQKTEEKRREEIEQKRAKEAKKKIIDTGSH